MHPSLSRRHIFPPLSLFHIATVADPCKKPGTKNTLLKGRPAKSGRVKKSPQPNPCPPILPPPSDLAGLTMRATILPNEACLTDVGTTSSTLKCYIVVQSFDIFCFLPLLLSFYFRDFNQPLVLKL